MANIKSFDKHNLGTIRKDIEAALKSVGATHGISLRLGNIRFTNDTFSTKLDVTLNDTTGSIVTPELAELRKMGKSYLGPAFDENKVYERLGKKVKIVGISPRRSKYPIIYQELSTGKRYKTSEQEGRSMVDPSYKGVTLRWPTPND